MEERPSATNKSPISSVKSAALVPFCAVNYRDCSLLDREGEGPLRARLKGADKDKDGLPIGNIEGDGLYLWNSRRADINVTTARRSSASKLRGRAATSRLQEDAQVIVGGQGKVQGCCKGGSESKHYITAIAPICVICAAAGA